MFYIYTSVFYYSCSKAWRFKFDIRHCEVKKKKKQLEKLRNKTYDSKENLSNNIYTHIILYRMYKRKHSYSL